MSRDYLTDDADSINYTGCAPFGPGDDYDIMNNRDYERDPASPDYENKPYGWGIETFEDPALLEANQFVRGVYFMAHSMYRVPVYPETSDSSRAVRDQRWKANSKHSKRRQRHSETVWNRLCDECKTHEEAVAKYTAWADRAVTVRYRDEI